MKSIVEEQFYGCTLVLLIRFDGDVCCLVGIKWKLASEASCKLRREIDPVTRCKGAQ